MMCWQPFWKGKSVQNAGFFLKTDTLGEVKSKK